ncbi:hypothetical protein IRZ80_06290 [Flavobacterium sp. HJJ]|nr:hypothetical protein [Flavobacterium sp. HJJ]
MNRRKVKTGRIFKEMPIVIHQLKAWISTVPIHVRKKHAQSYFDEFAFRPFWNSVQTFRIF